MGGRFVEISLWENKLAGGRIVNRWRKEKTERWERGKN